MKSIFVTALLFISILTFSQSEKIKIYDPAANAMEELNKAISKAQKEDKHVMVQIGGNWCPWCIKLHRFIEDHQKLDSLIAADYVFVRVNYSKENKNMDVLERLEYPQRFGFPVMVVLDGNGKRIHTQETGNLEEDKSYNENKIERFLVSWNKSALDPARYKK